MDCLLSAQPKNIFLISTKVYFDSYQRINIPHNLIMGRFIGWKCNIFVFRICAQDWAWTAEERKPGYDSYDWWTLHWHWILPVWVSWKINKPLSGSFQTFFWEVQVKGKSLLRHYWCKILKLLFSLEDPA